MTPKGKTALIPLKKEFAGSILDLGGERIHTACGVHKDDAGAPKASQPPPWPRGFAPSSALLTGTGSAIVLKSQAIDQTIQKGTGIQFRSLLRVACL